MIRHCLPISVATIALAATTSAMAGAALYPIVPVPNSALTSVFAINDNATVNDDVITGSWLNANGEEHGYVGPVSGTGYKTFDDPNAPKSGTQPRAINDNGYITGYSHSLQHKPAGFVP